jgi:hypothetical protein
MCAGRRRRGGNLGAIKIFAMTRHPKMRYDVARTADANPTCTMRLLSMIGKMTPPSELPAMTMPTAYARLRENQCEITDVATKVVSVFVHYAGVVGQPGKNNKPEPRPVPSA